jgi:eukaryotic-like serine/threonine-protein kinase
MGATAAPKIWILGADPKRLQWIMHHLTSQWVDAQVASLDTLDGPAILARLGDAAPDIIVFAISFADEPAAVEQLESLRYLSKRQASVKLIVLAENGDECWAVRTMQAGARDYLPTRNLSRDILLHAVENCLITPQAPAKAARAEEPTMAHNAPLLQLPGYEGLKAIASSNFSAVYLARSERLKKNVVVKILQHHRDTREQEDVDRFEREYQIISSIVNRSIAEIYDFGTHGDQMYLAMEYFPCGDLRDRLRNPMTEHESLYYLRSIAEALRVIHTFGVLHRDLKPANVMLREDNSPVLIDFGLARRDTESANATGLGKILGSPYYMSPEQAQAGKVDPRTDLYSLGVMFFEMLTGRKPYTGQSPIAIMSQHTRAPVPTLPAELAHRQVLLDRLMAKNPDERIRSAEALLVELKDNAQAA